ncbi:MAG: DnaD domain protein [Blautia sp.]|nr:DnaD domain protein [Lachnoclostridium sp.]MCM1212389.1 DnaD domain protein [Blautia sp.]
MGHLTIYQDNYSDSTVISNRFIDEYMQTANDAQLKIYLYLIRTMSARLSTSVSKIADIFNYTEKDVLRALKYWEKKKLLTLEYDESKTLTGIHLQDLSAPADSPAARSADSQTYIVPLSTTAEAAERTLPAENPYEKPAYTTEQLRAFKSDEAASRVLFITEQYLKKTLSASDMKSILFISDRLGFSEDLIDYLIQYCVDHGKKDLRYIEKVAVNWAQEGISTPRQAARYVHKYDKTVYDIMKALGKSSLPTQAEVTYITRWTKEFAFGTDVISAACEKTVLATDKHRFEYADSILNNWFKAGVHHKSDIPAAEEKFRQGRVAKSAANYNGNNKFNQFIQNQYDFDALEKELLSN